MSEHWITATDDQLM